MIRRPSSISGFPMTGTGPASRAMPPSGNTVCRVAWTMPSCATSARSPRLPRAVTWITGPKRRAGGSRFLIALDQFPALLLAGYAGGLCAGHQRRTCWFLEGLQNDHYDALKEAWERQFYIIALGHCGGTRSPGAARSGAEAFRGAARRRAARASGDGRTPLAAKWRAVRGVIERFGRHPPFANAVYGRLSSPGGRGLYRRGRFPAPSQDRCAGPERRLRPRPCATRVAA